MDARSLYESAKTRTGVRGFILRGLVFLYVHVRPRWPGRGNRRIEVFQRYLGGRGDVLLIGSGEPPKALSGFGSNKLIQLDMKPLEHVDVVADAEELNSHFSADSFDYVVSNSMLSHTLHPWLIVEQVHGVLKPGGIFYLTVPWVYPMMSEGEDYWRFSVPGLRNLIREAGFEEVEWGSLRSGHDAMRVVTIAYLSEALSFDNSLAYHALFWLFTWLLYPLQVIEYFFMLGRRRLHFTDAIVYVVARKPGPATPGVAGDGGMSGAP